MRDTLTSKLANFNNKIL